ncbi:MAG: hypothetical protein U1D98_03385 [Candidatus Gracilibacteria bacterium]|nr:hypothetical protein [Candidatus Gracilibacteria bacterium]
MNFIQEFQKLLLEKPRYNLKQVQTENCGYADTAIKSKNCYYCFGVFYCEDVYYGRYSRKCSDCTGIAMCKGCEWCVECVDCVDCYMTSNSKNCSACIDCDYCTDCHGCENCFGCTGLSKKKFRMFNEQLSEEEFKKRRAEIDLANPKTQIWLKQKLEEVNKIAIHQGNHQLMTEGSVGENISECKDSFQCYDSFLLEDCYYVVEANANKDCCDLTVCFESEACYQCIHSPMNYNCNFGLHIDQCSDSEFIAYSKNLKNCFGCVYIENKEYHILNQPYSEEEYHKKVAEIKKELMDQNLYNLSLFFISDYENHRWANEEDRTIEAMATILNGQFLFTI